jgi:Secretion system C-terminal sorting domain
MKHVNILFLLSIFLLSSCLFSSDSIIDIDNGAVVTMTSSGGDNSYLINSGDDDGQVIVNSGGSFSCWDPAALIDFTLIGDGDIALPVELSSFTAVQTTENFVCMNWTTLSESELQGYNILRSYEDNCNNSILLNPNLITATNSTSAHNYSYTDEFVEFDLHYYYWLESVGLNGITERYGPVSITLFAQDQEEEEFPPLGVPVGILSIYPNPFNPSTNITYHVRQDAEVVIEIYNSKGQKIYELQEGYKQANRIHSVHWNGQNQRGENVASGVYFFHFKSGVFKNVKRALLIK